jgi:hypothetical protein
VNTFSDLATVIPDPTMRKPMQSDVLSDNMETVCRVIGTLAGRVIATFLGTFAAGLLLLFVVHFYVEYKINVARREMGNALQKMDGDMKQLNMPKWK